MKMTKVSSYTDRPEYAASGCACPLSEVCQLIENHAGNCDARTERERWADLFARLDGAPLGETWTDLFARLDAAETERPMTGDIAAVAWASERTGAGRIPGQELTFDQETLPRANR